MYISWQVLNNIYKSKSTPTTDGGRMYQDGNRAGAFHVKWHMISKTSPVVDRFHVTYERTGRKAYYGITAEKFVYLGNRPDSGSMYWQDVERIISPPSLDDYDEIASQFLNNLRRNYPGDLRIDMDEAIADDEKVTQSAVDQKERSKIIGELRDKYSNYTEEQFRKAGLEKLRVSQRFGDLWTPDYYKELFKKIDLANGLTPTPSGETETISTTASSPVFSGTKVPLPVPTGYSVQSGPVSTFVPTSSLPKSGGGSNPSTSRFGSSRPWNKDK